MKTKRERLDFIRKIKGLTYDNLIDDESIVKPNSLRSSVYRDYGKVDYYLNLIAKKHNINPDWLISGIGEIENVTNSDEISFQVSEGKEPYGNGSFTDRSHKKEVTIIPLKALKMYLRDIDAELPEDYSDYFK